ncbi:hypothetical protein JK628_18060 [Shewanella sp. KX20019]|uniref:hypothetical protein n=1 Tax=Shewanella sp. KX20019 TaxID=2803864 RepID=UPI0019275F49|nr:hypothetical protein [Shewanella sp. KX20019]QQX79413.1 hypothetical protein JK628_18060 [Shewanella sp. KX20019]
MNRLTQAEKIQPHWWGKSLTASFLGLTLAFGLVAIFAWFGPGGIDAAMKVQLNMWLISLIWLPTLALSFLFKTAASAFFYLSLANLGVAAIWLGLWWLL